MTTSDPHTHSFLDWAKGSRVPLAGLVPGSLRQNFAALDHTVGDASIVALSEAIHGSAEPLQFRNALLQYLVEYKGFTAIAIESGLVESRIAHEYVRGSGEDLTTVINEGFSWTFERLPQNRELIQWLREYNANPALSRKINFYGFDVPGSPGVPNVRRGLGTALETALEYVADVDRIAAAALYDRVAPILQSIEVDFDRSRHRRGYDSLSELQRDALTAAIADLVGLLESRESQYTELTPNQYEWALRAAISARQVDQWLRQIPVGWSPSNECGGSWAGQAPFFPKATDIRDRAQVDNLEWIINREGVGGKVLIFASRFHVSTAPVETTWADGRGSTQTVAGIYLRKRYGKRLVTIGNLIGEGEYSEGRSIHPLKRAEPPSVEGLARQIGVPLFLLDLRSASAEVRNWLDQEHTLTAGEYAFSVNLGRAFDVLLYMDSVSAAEAT